MMAPPPLWIRYLFVYVALLAVVALLAATAQALPSAGAGALLVKGMACFTVAYAWLLVEPLVRTHLVQWQAVGCVARQRGELVVRRLAQQGRMAYPRLVVYASSRCEAQALGIGAGATVMISDTAAASEECLLEAVVAHELGHIRLRHSHVRFILLGAILTLAVGVDCPLLVWIPLNGFALWCLRQVEYAADQEAAKFTGAANVQRALEYLGSRLGDLPAWQTCFSTHPSFRSRIARLG